MRPPARHASLSVVFAIALALAPHARASDPTPGWGHIEAAAVDSLASPPGELGFVALAHLFFGHDRADLDAAAARSLDSAADYLRNDNTVTRILVVGHTDDSGDNDYNYRLAERRVAAVQAYLLARGVPAHLLHPTALGESGPIDETWTREGRHRNRRVEIYLVQRLPWS